MGVVVFFVIFVFLLVLFIVLWECSYVLVVLILFSLLVFFIPPSLLSRCLSFFSLFYFSFLYLVACSFFLFSSLCFSKQLQDETKTPLANHEGTQQTKKMKSRILWCLPFCLISQSGGISLVGRNCDREDPSASAIGIPGAPPLEDQVGPLETH